MYSRHTKIGIGILAVIIILAGGFYFYTFYTARQTAAHNAAYVAALQKAAQASLQGDKSAAIAELQAQLPNAPTLDDRARQEQALAGNLFERGEGDDWTQAAALYRQDISNTAISPQIRAGMLDELAHMYDELNFQWYQQNFTVPPLDVASMSQAAGDIFADGHTPGGLVYLGLLQLSDKTYSNSFAEYSIAQFYALELAGGSVASSSRMAVAQAAQQYIALGDTHAGDGANFSYPLYYKLLGSLFKANALAVSNTVLNNIDETKIKQAFTGVVTEASTAPDGSFTQGIGLETRFYYAAYLARVYGWLHWMARASVSWRRGPPPEKIPRPARPRHASLRAQRSNLPPGLEIASLRPQ